MLKVVLAIIFCIQFSSLSGNNIQVSNVVVTGQNTVDDYTFIEFDITWENSWRIVGSSDNWDAAWIFIKYRIGTSGAWNHAWLNDSGHLFCDGTSLTTGLLSPDLPFESTTNPALGVFLYMANPGNGNFNCQNVQLRWNYGANGVADNENIYLKVFAIEHVYVPEASFKIGSGGTETGAFYTYPNTTESFSINDESEITVGPSAGNLYYGPSAPGYSGDQQGPIPSAYPKGFRAIYAMKYEISQQGYVDFLNTLTRTQQQSRVRANIAGSSVTNQFVMPSSTTVNMRSGIWSFSSIPPSPSPVIFSCNFNANLIPNEPNDGQNIACNFLLAQDVWAYLDWAGLRPMTELEYEKICRGPLNPVPNELAWGNNYLRSLQAFVNPGYANETFQDSFANYNGGTNLGPCRSGIFAKSYTDRIFSGGSFYGIMELSLNLWERAVTVGNITGRAFIGNHGDGLIGANADANATSWPTGTLGGGGSLRGGGGTDIAYHVSNRTYGSWPTINGGFVNWDGGRGVRTAPQ